MTCELYMRKSQPVMCRISQWLALPIIVLREVCSLCEEHDATFLWFLFKTVYYVFWKLHTIQSRR